MTGGARVRGALGALALLLAAACGGRQPQDPGSEDGAAERTAVGGTDDGGAQAPRAPAGTEALARPEDDGGVQPAGGEDPAAEPEVPDYAVREGRALFQHYCATCHGPEGRGDGFNAYNLDPRPRDLADPAFQSERSDDDLATIIALGGGAGGLSTAMPPWGRTLNRRQLHYLVVYVRTLPETPAP